MFRRTLFSFAAMMLTISAGEVQSEPLTDDVKREVVAQMNTMLDEIYVIPETATVLRKEVQARLDRGEFDAILSSSEFAEALTRVLQDISHDLHLRVSADGSFAPSGGAPAGSPVRVRQGGPAGGGGSPVRVRQGGESAGGDDGPVRVRQVRPAEGVDLTAPGDPTIPEGLDQIEAFPEARMLSGNVGYVPVTLFSDLPGAREIAAARMATVAGADALIFDLRRCMGGFPGMVHFLTSYLYDEKPRHLLTYYHAGGEPDSAYTFAEIPGARMPDADVYILTSSFTASGGEEFTHTLKHHGRATVVGEITAGAGHGGAVHAMSHGFSVFMPNFRPVHPVTGGGWEDRGVNPDVEVGASRALDTAHHMALQSRLESGVSAENAKSLHGEMARLEEAINDATPDVESLHGYAGQYDIREVTVTASGLFLQRTGGPKVELVPDAGIADQFHLAIMPDGGVRFARDAGGKVVAVEVRYPNSEEWQRSWRDGDAPGS